VDERPVDAPATPPGGTPAPAAPTRRGAELRTFLIADVRGYTSYTEEHGDEDAAALAAQFAELVELVAAEFEGVLLEVRGDEALVVFFSARQALRAAVELQARSASLPRPIGIGLDAGEAIPVGNGYRGTALNVAARLCAAAKGGDIVASEAVIHMAARIDGVAYLDARSMRLKGLEEPVRAVSVVPESRAARGFGRGARRAGRRAADPRILIPVVATTAIVGVVAIVVLTGALGRGPFDGDPTRPSPSPPASPIVGDISVSAPALVLLEAATGGLATPGQIAARSPGEAIFADGSFWQLEQEPPGILRIDPATANVLATFAAPMPQPAGFTVDDGTLWVADSRAPRVIPIDIATRTPGEPIRLTVDPGDVRGADDIVVAGGSLWVSVAICCEVRRLDPATGRTEDVIEVDGSSLALDDDRIWVLGQDGNLTAIDVATGEIAAPEVVLPPDDYAAVAVGGGWVWTAGARQGVLLRIDRSGRIDRTIPTGAGARAVSFADGTVWVGNELDGTVTAVDALTGNTDDTATGHRVTSVVAGAGRVLAGVTPAVDPTAGLEGPTLLVAVAGDPFEVFDPAAMSASWEMRQVAETTCARLVRYVRAPPPDGWRLEPDLAAAMPEVSADGRTYTFTIRDDFVFSPPSNEPVTAETVARTLERVLAPGFGTTSWWGFLGDIRGASAYQGGLTDSVEGIAVDGDRLILTLATTGPDLLDRLAMPFYCVVPIGTPVVAGGFSPPDGLASAGPFYIAKADDQALTLRRNPNFRGPRVGDFDNIVVYKDQDIDRSVGRVEAGQLDLVIGPGDPALVRDGPIAAAWGPGSDAASAGDQRYFGDPTLEVMALGVKVILATGVDAPLADVTVRQAIARAIDRERLAAIAGAVPADQLIPPSMPGHAATGPLPLTPDVEGAKALLAGRSIQPFRLAYDPGCGLCQEFAQSIARDIAAIDLTVELQAVDSVYNGDADLSIFFNETFQLDPVRYLDSYIAVGPWAASAPVDKQQALGFLSGQERIDAAADLLEEWAAEDSILIPLVTSVAPEFFSERVGCQSYPASFVGVDLAAVCLD
jgi:ABC-type transport system substrate-binding protein/class 3 adenylate cyclase